MRDSARQVERLQAIRLRYSINTHLEAASSPVLFNPS
jgi:hypothetical protein